MKTKLSILYSWFIRLTTCILPNIPLFMRFRGFLYSFMMKSCGRNFQVTSSAILNPLRGLVIGDNVYIAHNTVIIGVDLEIGDNVLIGPNCVISSGNHVFEHDSFRFSKSTVVPVRIGRNSWIAGNCSLLGGAIMPAKSILGAGSVLNKQFYDEKSLYAGVPAKYIKPIS
jgi:acetyltransferase-like isoleucine patch superfamily enzyme